MDEHVRITWAQVVEIAKESDMTPDDLRIHLYVDGWTIVDDPWRPDGSKT